MAALKQTLVSAFGILGVSAPEHMKRQEKRGELSVSASAAATLAIGASASLVPRAPTTGIDEQVHVLWFQLGEQS